MFLGRKSLSSYVRIVLCWCLFFLVCLFFSLFFFSFLKNIYEIVCASRIPPRQLAAGTRRPGGSDVWRLRSSLILAASWISLMASGELPNFLFCKKTMIIEHNSESITLGCSWGLLGAILKPFRKVLGSPGAVWEALGVVLGALGAVLGWSWELLGRS